MDPTPENTIDFFFFDDANKSNGTNTIQELLAFTEEARIEAIVYGILFVFAVAGNLTVFISLLKIRRRKSRIQKMILHLTIADLIVTFVMIPLEISWRITVEWIAGDTLCRMLTFMRAFGLYLSSMVLICISIDRYSAIVHPLRLHDAQRRTNIMLLVAWVTSFVCSIPQSVIYHVESHPKEKNFEQCVTFNVFHSEYLRIIYQLLVIMLLYGAPLVVIIFCYSRIIWKIRQRSKRANKDPSTSSPHPSKRIEIRLSDISHMKRARSNTLKMTSVILITFICCWTPYVVIDLWYLFDSRSAEALDLRLQSTLFIFAITNSCVNPLVYGNYMLRCCKRRPPPQRRNPAVRKWVATPTVVSEVPLELKRASPVRRPLNRRDNRDRNGEDDCSA